MDSGLNLHELTDIIYCAERNHIAEKSYFEKKVG